MNQGVVDKDGHWIPLFSTGSGGLDQDEWYERKIEGLKEDLGYDCTPVEVQFRAAQAKAAEKVFGKEWWDKGVSLDDPRVKAELAEEQARYDEFVLRRDQYRLEKTHRLDAMFMQAAEAEEGRRPGGWNEVGLVDEGHVKETCASFCERYKGDVGMMTNALDGMDKMGLNPWCTCSDCGAQFQLYSYESFDCMVDQDAYHGDGGIGVILTRVLCEDCMSACSCHACGELRNPNTNCRESLDEQFEMYDFLACLMHDWLGVCYVCSEGFRRRLMQKFDEKREVWRNTETGREFDREVRRLAKELGMSYSDNRCGDGRKLYEALKGTIPGRMAVNALRRLLEDHAEEYFGHAMDTEWFGDRLDTDLPGQLMLPGFEKAKTGLAKEKVTEEGKEEKRGKGGNCR